MTDAEFVQTSAQGCACTRSSWCDRHRDVPTPRQRAARGPVDRQPLDDDVDELEQATEGAR
jgi:hypothetical protein